MVSLSNHEVRHRSPFGKLRMSGNMGLAEL